MREFRLALTGDFLNEAGESAYTDIGLDQLREAGNICCHFLRDQAPAPGDAHYYDHFYSLEVCAHHIRDIDGLIVLRPWVKAATFAEGAANLCVIGRSGAGYDKLDLAACTAHHVAVFNAPLALNHATASSALLFMLALSKKLLAQDRLTRTARWDLQAATMGSELTGRTLGIIGLGHSGRELARLAAAFHMQLLAFSPHADPAQAAGLGVRLVSLDQLLSESDFVSLHCRLTPATRRLLGAREIALMKKSAYLINVDRGELVDQAALVAALTSGKIAGAALDVFEREPVPADDPLLKLDNVILAPHWSCSTSDVWQATGRAMAEGMIRAARGEVPANVVNPDVLAQPEFRAKLARFAPA